MTFALERKSTALAIPKGGTLFRFSFARWGDPKGTHGSRSLGSAPALRFYQIVYGPVKAMGFPPVSISSLPRSRGAGDRAYTAGRGNPARASGIDHCHTHRTSIPCRKYPFTPSPIFTVPVNLSKYGGAALPIRQGRDVTKPDRTVGPSGPIGFSTGA